jgi:hypothetical protein
MAIVEVLRLFKGERGNATEEVHKYLVKTDDKQTTAFQARTASFGDVSIPAEGSILPGTAMTAHVEAERLTENPLYWAVTVTYSLPSSNGFAVNETKPAEGGKWNKSIRGRTLVWEEEIYTAKNADGEVVTIQNSAGQRFLTGINKQYYDEEFIVNFTTDAPNWSAIQACRGNVNDAEISLTVRGVTRTFAIGTLSLMHVEWEYNFNYTNDPDAPDLNFEYSFQYKPDGWAVRKVDEGYYVIDPEGEEVEGPDEYQLPLKAIVDQRTKHDIQLAAFLKDGSLLPAGEDVQLISYFIREKVSFADLLEGI